MDVISEKADRCREITRERATDYELSSNVVDYNSEKRQRQEIIFVILQVTINDVTGKQMVDNDGILGHVQEDEHVSEIPLKRPSVYVKFIS